MANCVVGEKSHNFAACCPINLIFGRWCKDPLPHRPRKPKNSMHVLNCKDGPIAGGPSTAAPSCLCNYHAYFFTSLLLFLKQISPLLLSPIMQNSQVLHSNTHTYISTIISKLIHLTVTYTTLDSGLIQAQTVNITQAMRKLNKKYVNTIKIELGKNWSARCNGSINKMRIFQSEPGSE